MNITMQESIKMDKASRCTNCLNQLDAATGLEKRRPKEGDISVCAYCGTVMIFNNELLLEGLSGEALEDIYFQLDPKTVEIIKKVQAHFKDLRFPYRYGKVGKLGEINEKRSNPTTNEEG